MTLAERAKQLPIRAVRIPKGSNPWPLKAGDVARTRFAKLRPMETTARTGRFFCKSVNGRSGYHFPAKCVGQRGRVDEPVTQPPA